MHVGGFWMGFGWFLDGLKQILMDFECMFGYFLDGFEMVQDRFRLMDVLDGFWRGLGWISMHFGWISAGFWIDFDGFWMDFGSSLIGSGWFWMDFCFQQIYQGFAFYLPPRIQDAHVHPMSLAVYLHHIYQAHLLSISPPYPGGFWMFWDGFWVDLMDIGWNFAYVVDFGWFLDGSGMVF